MARVRAVRSSVVMLGILSRNELHGDVKRHGPARSIFSVVSAAQGMMWVRQTIYGRKLQLGRIGAKTMQSRPNGRATIFTHACRVAGITIIWALIMGSPGIWLNAGTVDLAQAPQDAPATQRLVVRGVAQVAERALNAIAATHPRLVEPTGTLSGTYLVSYATLELATNALDQLTSDPDIAWVERDRLVPYSFNPGDPLNEDQLWIQSIDLPAAWNISTGSPTVVVAVVDSGVSATHPDLQGKLLPGHDFFDDDDVPDDQVGHGTAVAGIIAARGNDGIGIAGVAMETMVLPVKVGSVDGSPISAIAAGIVWAVDNGAHIINLSLGSDFPSDALHDAVIYAYEHDVPVVAAAGNEPEAISYPGAYPETISVGASTPWGTLTGFTSRSNRVDLVAPGTGVLASWWGEDDGDTWASVSGTSFAAPMVAGTLALLRSLDPTLTTEDLRTLLHETAIPVGDPESEPGAGAGQLDAGAALSTFISQAFDRTWLPADSPVASGTADRTWVWGPEAIATGFESYDQATHGERLIRYYDKARMEITNPAALSQDPWFVTNGLLARELITGKMQVGDHVFVTRHPAQIAVAGDWANGLSPTYADFFGWLSAPAASPGSALIKSIDSFGRITEEARFALYGVTAAWRVSETDHQIASVFWSYLNSLGLIDMNGELVMGPLFSPTFYATGLPITEAYWTEVEVEGVMADVLVQCFERRCLTYTPSNSENWRVEMGNVGQHYFTWRYAEQQDSAGTNRSMSDRQASMGWRQ